VFPSLIRRMPRARFVRIIGCGMTTILLVAPRALEFLCAHKLGDLGPAVETLLKLMLSFAEVTTAIEFYDQKEVVDGFPLDRFQPTEPLSDLASQK